MSANGHAQAGFTLVELIIALTLLSFIVVLLFGGIRLGNQSWAGSEAKGERTAELRLVWRFLQEHVIHARPVYRLTDKGNQILFSGAANGFEFVTPMPGNLGIGGYYLLRIHRGEQKGRTQLVLNRWLYHPEVLEGGEGIPKWDPIEEGGGDAGEGPKEKTAYYTHSVLVDALKGLELAYFGSDEPAKEPEWHEEWIEKATLPLALRIRVRDARGAWPEMILRLSGL